jgi:hypothetical protein
MKRSPNVYPATGRFYDSYADALARRLLESSRLWQSFVHFKTLPLHYGPLIDPSRS